MSEIVSLSSVSQALSGSDVQVDHTRGPNGVSADASGLAKSTGLGDDSVALSSAAHMVQQALGAGSDARAVRVAELRQQIQSGQYVTDPAAISQAILNASIAGESAG